MYSAPRRSLRNCKRGLTPWGRHGGGVGSKPPGRRVRKLQVGSDPEGGACKATPMATADLTVISVGREGASVGDVMAEIHRRLERQDAVGFQMHAMGTSL